VAKSWRNARRDVIVFAPRNENSFTEAKRAKGKGVDQIPKQRFTFDPSIPGYGCLKGKVLRYRNRTTKQKANEDYLPLEIYQADPSDCAFCPLKAPCERGGSGARTVRRQEHEELIDAMKDRMNTAEAKKKYRDRGCTICEGLGLEDAPWTAAVFRSNTRASRRPSRGRGARSQPPNAGQASIAERATTARPRNNRLLKGKTPFAGEGSHQSA